MALLFNLVNTFDKAPLTKPLSSEYYREEK